MKLRKEQFLAILIFLFTTGNAVAENWILPVASDQNIWIDMDSVRSEANGNKIFQTYVGRDPYGPIVPFVNFKLWNSFNCSSRVMYWYVESTKTWEIDSDLATHPEFEQAYVRLLCN